MPTTISSTEYMYIGMVCVTIEPSNSILFYSNITVTYVLVTRIKSMITRYENYVLIVHQIAPTTTITGMVKTVRRIIYQRFDIKTKVF